MFRRKWFTLLITCILVASLLAGCTQKAPEAAAPAASETTKTADVVVVGGGLSGLSAAVSAADNGAKVILIEKMPFTGGSSMLSGGAMLAAESHLQKQEGMTQTKDELEADWFEIQKYSPIPEGYPNREFVRMIIEEAPTTIKFAEDNGVKFSKPSSYYPEVKDRLHTPAEGGGAGITKPLEASARAKGVEILLETTAKKLIKDDKGAVIGVVAEGMDGKEITINAKAVILSNGGFSRNPEMIGEISPTSKQHISVAGLGNVGDGYKMAEEVGADFYGDEWIIGLRSQAVEGKSALNGFSWTTGLYTTLEGKRFANENAPYSALYNATTDQGIVEYFLIFDKTMAEKLEPGIEQGVVFKGDNVEALAQASGMNPEIFKATIERYNELAKKGKDEDYGKQSELMVPLAEGTLYALRVKATHMGTMGGVKTTKGMEVLNKEGKIIPGLYATGEMANRPFYGRVYVTGSSLQIAATTGRIAGANAAKAVK